MSAVATTDAAPTRTTVSLLRSFVGSYLRQAGGWIAVADLVELMAHVGSSATVTRSALSRLKAKGLLVGEPAGGSPGYRLAAGAHKALDRGDRRIYGHPAMALGDPWMLIVFSVPEQDRRLRHRLRTELTWLGCGVVAPGTWIGPGHLMPEAREVLAAQGLSSYVTFFETAAPVTDTPLAEAVQGWWDLADLDARYGRLIATHGPVATAWRAVVGSDQDAFVQHLRLLDDWRSIPYLDPGLPAQLLPHQWRGADGLALFTELNAALERPAMRHVERVTRTF